jgi:hypothetical protein
MSPSNSDCFVPTSLFISTNTSSMCAESPFSYFWRILSTEFINQPPLSCILLVLL